MNDESTHDSQPGYQPVIAFDGSILDGGPITGVGGSFLTTLRAYAKASPFRCVLLLPRELDLAQRASIPPVDNVRTVPCLSSGRWRRLRSLREGCVSVQADLLHSPVTAVPGRCPCPTIATVHDLPWLYPELRQESGSRLFRRLAVRLAARTAAAIIVPSRATLADLRRFSRDDVPRAHVIPHGVEQDLEPPVDDPIGPFLVLGDDRPRKNNDRLRRAHAMARALDPELPGLRFVGPSHGYVEESGKWQLLRNARALVQVSLLEGFGLPVLEAFARGTPVICGDRTSLPEIAGDAALLVNPTDEAAITEALSRIHRDTALRAALRARGLERVREFTPRSSAAAWIELHERLLSQR